MISWKSIQSHVHNHGAERILGGTLPWQIGKFSRDLHAICGWIYTPQKRSEDPSSLLCCVRYVLFRLDRRELERITGTDLHGVDRPPVDPNRRAIRPNQHSIARKAAGEPVAVLSKSPVLREDLR